MRPLADRCLISFGSNAGPPMLPNYFYNNNYTIVQTKDHVMILTEMKHDARIIRLGAKDICRRTSVRGSAIRSATGKATRWSSRPPTSIRRARSERHPVGLSWGVGEPEGDRAVHPHRAGHDPLPVHAWRIRSTFTAPFTGELPFNRIDEQVYEYACHEGNHAMTNILKGARLAEQGGGVSQQR